MDPIILLAVAPIEPPKIAELLKPEPIPIVEQVTITVTDKIESNYYQCDTDKQWIRLDNAECLDKHVEPLQASIPNGVVQNTTKKQTPVVRAVAQPKTGSPPLTWWGRGQCTYWVASKRSVGYWNNASEWIWQAQRDGWETGSTPRVGAIGQKGNHVVLVESVNNDRTFNLSEMNYQGVGVVTRRTVSNAGWRFIY